MAKSAAITNARRGAVRKPRTTHPECTGGREVWTVRLSFGARLCIMENDNNTVQAFLLRLNEGDVEELGEGPMLTANQLTKCLGVAAVTSSQRKARRALNGKIQVMTMRSKQSLSEELARRLWRALTPESSLYSPSNPGRERSKRFGEDATAVVTERFPSGAHDLCSRGG